MRWPGRNLVGRRRLVLPDENPGFMLLPPGFRLHWRPASGIGARGESVGQAFGVLIAIFGFLFEAAEHDQFQVAGHVLA